jgi:hypothetical protein
VRSGTPAEGCGEGFLTPETIRTVEPKLAAISDAIAASER